MSTMVKMIKNHVAKVAQQVIVHVVMAHQQVALAARQRLQLMLKQVQENKYATTRT